MVIPAQMGAADATWENVGKQIVLDLAGSGVNLFADPVAPAGDPGVPAASIAGAAGAEKDDSNAWMYVAGAGAVVFLAVILLGSKSR